MRPEPPIVGEADLECELTIVRSAAAGGAAGIFGPASVMLAVGSNGTAAGADAATAHQYLIDPIPIGLGNQ
jgi:hypothetical protein